MTLYVLYACLAGVLVGLSRQLNGRLSLSSSPLVASLWNHIVGLIAITLVGIAFGNLLLPGWENTPWYAYFGGPIGVIFVAAGSWVIPRIGAVNTALLIIGGQMASGVLLDLIRTGNTQIWLSLLGVALIIGGSLVAQNKEIKKKNP